MLINDISDHLPVFAVYDYNQKKKRVLNEVKYKRLRTSESLSAFKDELWENWKGVCEETDVNTAYNRFLDTFIELYKNNCPLKQYINKNKYVENPWMTKGLQNACKNYISYSLNRKVKI